MHIFCTQYSFRRTSIALQAIRTSNVSKIGEKLKAKMQSNLNSIRNNVPHTILQEYFHVFHASSGAKSNLIMITFPWQFIFDHIVMRTYWIDRMLWLFLGQFNWDEWYEWWTFETNWKWNLDRVTFFTIFNVFLIYRKCPDWNWFPCL